MICPKCGYAETKVVDSRPLGNGKWRRRECLNCGARFNTFEGVAGRAKESIRTNIFDQCETHDNCTVEIFSNSITGETSVGWWENDKKH